MSDTKPAIHVYSAINAVMLALSKEGITKDRKNQQGSGYSFRGIDDVYNVLCSLLASNKLTMLPRCTERIQEERQAKSGGALFYTTVKMEFDLVSALDGSCHTIGTYGEAMDSGDKSTNKAMSAAYKYAAFQAFCIPTEADNDADAHTHEVTTKKPLGEPVVSLATTDQISELSMLSLDGCKARIIAALEAYKRKDVTDFTEKEAAAVLKKLNNERVAAATKSIKK